MQTYTSGRNLFGSLSSNTSSTNLTVGDTLINEKIRELVSWKPWDFRERTRTVSTVASQQFYNLPNDNRRLKNVTVTIGSTIYTPKECKSRTHWDYLNRSTTTSNIPEWYYVFNKQLGFFPTPSSATTDAVTYIYERGHIDLSVADYTAGTITTTSTVSSVTTVTGSGTTWTSAMVGRYLRIDAPTGDHQWYEIATVPTSTTLTLTLPYLGTAISAGSGTYTIGQVSLVPEDFQMVPIYGALEIYFTSIQPERERAEMYKNLFREGKSNLQIENGSKTTGVII